MLNVLKPYIYGSTEKLKTLKIQDSFIVVHLFQGSFNILYLQISFTYFFFQDSSPEECLPSHITFLCVSFKSQQESLSIRIFLFS
jgi:hypothetical protein